MEHAVNDPEDIWESLVMLFDWELSGVLVERMVGIMLFIFILFAAAMIIAYLGDQPED